MILYDAVAADDNVEIMKGVLLKIQAQYSEL